jgi:hypothetical protein
VARSASRQLLDQIPSPDAMVEIISDLRSMDDDAALALMSAAYLDHALELLLKTRFRRLTADEHRRMFDGAQNAILGAFSAKIRLAHALGLLLAEEYADLLLINDIRNAFAHSLHRDVDFANPHIAADCAKLGYTKLFPRPPDDLPISAKPRDLFLDTVRRIFLQFKKTSDEKSAFDTAIDRLYSQLAQGSDSGVRAPSRHKLPRPSRRNRPT